MNHIIKILFVVIYNASVLGIAAFLIYQGITRPYICPDPDNIIFKNDTISVFAPIRKGVPCPIVRDATVFTAGSSGNNYYYPQIPLENSITFLSQTNYHYLPQSTGIQVTVDGLSPDSTYFFHVSGSNEIHQVSTKPPGDSLTAFRFAVIGDTQGLYDPIT